MYTAAETAEKIKNLAKKQGISQETLLKKAGSNKNGIFIMSNRGSMPRADNLAKFADILNCSVDYLLGRTECQDIFHSVLLSDDEALLLDRYSRLDEGRKEILRARALELVLDLNRGGTSETETPAVAE